MRKIQNTVNISQKVKWTPAHVQGLLDVRRTSIKHEIELFVTR